MRALLIASGTLAVLLLLGVTRPNYSQLKSPLGFGLMLANGVPAVNTATIESLTVAQSGAPIYCPSTNGTPAYTCSFAGTHALAAYTMGMFVLLRPDVTNLGACSLNIDSQGVKGIKQNDGSTDPAPGAVVAGKFYWLFYDGTVFRMQ
jgi:hypothetical protein